MYGYEETNPRPGRVVITSVIYYYHFTLLTVE